MRIPTRRKCLMCQKVFTEEMLVCSECDKKILDKRKKSKKARQKK